MRVVASARQLLADCACGENEKKSTNRSVSKSYLLRCKHLGSLTYIINDRHHSDGARGCGGVRHTMDGAARRLCIRKTRSERQAHQYVSARPGSIPAVFPANSRPSSSAIQSDVIHGVAGCFTSSSVFAVD
jgi:hypothetical protein